MRRKLVGLASAVARICTIIGAGSLAGSGSLEVPEMARALEAMAFVPVTDSTPERATRFIADEAALWRPVIRATNIEID